MLRCTRTYHEANPHCLLLQVLLLSADPDACVQRPATPMADATVLRVLARYVCRLVWVLAPAVAAICTAQLLVNRVTRQR